MLVPGAARSGLRISLEFRGPRRGLIDLVRQFRTGHGGKRIKMTESPDPSCAFRTEPSRREIMSAGIRMSLESSEAPI